MKSAKFISLFVILIISSIANCQITQEYYFNDSLTGLIDNMHDYIEVEDGIIVSGEETRSSGELPLIIKIGTDGLVKWSTLNSTLIIFNFAQVRHFDIFKFEDGYIYGESHIVGSSTGHNILWKVDALTGEVIYAKEFFSRHNEPMYFSDFDDTKYLATYTDHQGGWPYNSGFVFLDKSTGDTLSTHLMGEGTSFSGIGVDANKNIIYWRNGIVTKYNRDDISTTIWTRNYLGGANDVYLIDDVYIDRYDDMYLFGRNNSNASLSDGIIIKVNLHDGKQDWNTFAHFGDIRMSDYVDRDNKLFVSYRTNLTGGGLDYFKLCRIDKETGNQDWYAFHNAITIGAPSSSGGGHEAAISIDLDCSNDIYLTGYYGSANFEPAVWCNMKLSGSDGSFIYNTTFSHNTSVYDTYSVGLATCVFENTPIILGHLQDTLSPNYWENLPYFTKLNPSNGDIVQSNQIDGAYQLKSKTLDIINVNDTIYTMKQIGASVIIEKYNELGNILWQGTYTDTSILEGVNMAVSEDRVYFSAFIYEQDSLPPFHTNIKTNILLFQLDANTGITLNDTSYNTVTGNAQVISLEADGESALMVFNRGGGLDGFTHWKSSGGSGTINGFSPFVNGSHNYTADYNVIINDNQDSVLVIGMNNIYSFNKSNSSIQSIYSFSESIQAYDYCTIGDTLFICGLNSASDQVLIAIDRYTLTTYWEQNYGGSGSLYRIDTDVLGNLYVTGSFWGQISIYQIDPATGNINWSDYETNFSENTIPYDLELNNVNNYIAIAGAVLNPAATSSSYIKVYDLFGDTLYTRIDYNTLNENGDSWVCENLRDSLMWIGGSLNNLSVSEAAYIFELYGIGGALVDMKELQIETKIFIYPNPTKDFITIKNLNEPFNYKIYDINGKMIDEQTNYKGKSINIKTLTPGVYTFSLDNKGSINSIRFVVI